MAMTETARLEREAEETRARLEQTLGELRGRMQPGQLLDQATDYFRHNSGRAYLSNLRDEVVHNPMPVALIGAGIAWLAISGTMGRRQNGGGGRYGYDAERDWGRTAATADDLEHGGDGPSMAQRAKQTAQGWADSARDAMSGARDSASDLGDRASTAYDEAIGRARTTSDEWSESAGSTAQRTRESLREGADAMRERAAGVYEQTAGGMRRAAHRAADYGRAARHTFDSDGALMTFCREQPLLVAGLGIAVGAALGAMIPSSRQERRVMGETSREMQDRVRETMHTATDDTGAQTERSRGDEGNGRYSEGWERESWQGQGVSGGDATRRESRQGQSYREAASDLERGTKQGDRASNVESEPSSAPYAESAEADAMGTPATPGEERKERT